MSGARVLRIPVSGGGDSQDIPSQILIHVTGNAGPSLELNLLGTDSSYIYVSSIRKNKISGLKVKNSPLKDDEWNAVLAWLFYRKEKDADLAESLKDVEIVANVKPGKDITLVVRRMVSGIAQRLGSITLEQDESQEIDLFDWACTAAGAVDASDTTAKDLQQRYDSQQDTIDKLNAQLEDLIEAKKQQETELLDKFRQLLNSKKAKIRDQMRLLSTAQVDEGTARRVQSTRAATRTTTRSTKTTSARKGKRKAASPHEEVEELDDEEEMADAGTNMGAPENEDAFDRADTPDRHDDDEATADEDDFDESPSRHTRSEQAKAPAPSQNKNDNKSSSEDLPPRRDLPFMIGSTKKDDNKPAVAADGDDDDDETDDEL